MIIDPEKYPSEPKRVRAFANFFKNYMSLSTIVVAALPIPISAFKLVPTYNSQSSFLATYTSLFCFLTLGFIFFSRHSIARFTFFSGSYKKRFYQTVSIYLGFLPLLLIVLSISLTFVYQAQLGYSISHLKADISSVENLYFVNPTQKMPDSFNIGNRYDIVNLVENAKLQNKNLSLKYPAMETKFILENTSLDLIPSGSILMLVYVSLFVTAEAAFILMALREYLQDLIGLTEIELIDENHLGTSRK